MIKNMSTNKKRVLIGGGSGFVGRALTRELLQRDYEVIILTRTPRERDWPKPTMFSTPSALNSPTTAQTLEVPISRPTMMDEESNIFLFGANGFGWFG